MQWFLKMVHHGRHELLVHTRSIRFLLDSKTNIKLDGVDDVGTQHLKKWYLVNMRIVQSCVIICGVQRRMGLSTPMFKCRQLLYLSILLSSKPNFKGENLQLNQMIKLRNKKRKEKKRKGEKKKERLFYKSAVPFLSYFSYKDVMIFEFHHLLDGSWTICYQWLVHMNCIVKSFVPFLLLCLFPTTISALFLINYMHPFPCVCIYIYKFCLN